MSEPCWTDGADDTVLLHSSFKGLDKRLTEIILESADAIIQEQPQTRQFVFELLGSRCVRDNFPEYEDRPLTLEPPYYDPHTRSLLAKEIEEKLIRLCHETKDMDELYNGARWGAFLAAVQDIYHKHARAYAHSAATKGSVAQVAPACIAITQVLYREEMRSRADAGGSETDLLDGKIDFRKLAGLTDLEPDSMADVTSELLARQRGDGNQTTVDTHARLRWTEARRATGLSTKNLSNDEFGPQLKFRLHQITGAEHAHFKSLWQKVRRRSVPPTLRRFLWHWLLIPSAFKEKVTQQLARMSATGDIRDPRDSSSSGMIQATTRVRFRMIHACDVEDEPWGQRVTQVAMDILNMYFVLTRQQYASHVSVAVVLASVMAMEAMPDTEDMLVMLCSLVNHHVPGLPTLNQELALSGSHLAGSRLTPEMSARGIWTLIHQQDRELYAVIAELTAHDKGALRWTWETDTGPDTLVPLLKPWCEVAFAGFLRLNAVLFVWDQCFQFGWDSLAVFGAKILELSRDECIRATAKKETATVAAFMSALEAHAWSLTTSQLRAVETSNDGPT